MTSIRGYRWPGALALTLAAAATVGAIDLDVAAAKIDTGLRIARGPEAGRAAFHRPDPFGTNDPSIERVEVITEYRRLVLIGEERIAQGDNMFGQGGRMVEEALRPYRRRVSVVAHLRFSPQNVYVTAPSVDVALTDVSRLDMQNITQYAAAAARNQTLALMGVNGEAVFDAAAIGQTSRTAVVRVGGKELARVTIDFSRLD